MPRSLPSFAYSPSRIVAPNRPTPHASRKTTPLTRPSVMDRARPRCATSIALSRSAGMRSDIAKLLKVPSGMTPIRQLVPANHGTDCAVSARHHHLGGGRDEGLDPLHGTEAQHRVIGECLPYTTLDLRIEAARPRAQDQESRSTHRLLTRLSNPGGSSVTDLKRFGGPRLNGRPAKGGYEVLIALIVLILLLILFGGGGMLAASLNFLWWILIIGLVLWVLGFFFRAAEGGGRWYYW